MGALGKFGDTIEDVSSRIAKFSVSDFYNKYLVQTNDEIANVARRTMKNKLDASTMVDRKLLQEVIDGSSITDKNYVSATNKLIQSLNNKDMEEATSVARDISEKFKENKYLDLLKQAEDKKVSMSNSLNNADSEIIENIFKQNTSIPKVLNSFTDENDVEKIKGMAYRVQGKKRYFGSEDPKTNKVRAGVVGGVYMTGMTTARLSHGGSLTKNEYGEHDIVGIPFI